MTDKARYIMMGGFLGAGKTTSVLQLARHLHEQGLKVGLITNRPGEWSGRHRHASIARISGGRNRGRLFLLPVPFAEGSS